MPKTSRRKRHRILALAAAGAMALVVVLIVAIVIVVLRRPESPTPSAVPPTALPPTGPSAVPPTTKKPRPEFQDASCPDVQMISIPGTWESSPQLDPFNPVQFPRALLLNVTNPIRAQFGSDRLEIFTVPYTAQFHNPLSADQQMSYNDSRVEGTRATLKAITDMNNRCPLTSYVFVGFSQGAVIAGDIAGDIGNGRGPVDDDLVLGVTVIADGRRQDNV
ncbi:MAG TPA: cutinase family protein, partial [Mycobacterium sp.]|nr:cutinase family protein [Mycobacterium sp.]